MISIQSVEQFGKDFNNPIEITYQRHQIMEDFTNLPLTQLKNLCQILGWVSKKRTKEAIIQEIQAKKIDSAQIAQAISQVSVSSNDTSGESTSQKKKTSKAKNLPDSTLEQINDRMNLFNKKMTEFENMQSFLIKKLSDIEVRINGLCSPTKGINSQSLDSIKKILLSQISSGRTVSTDEIRQFPSLSKYSLVELERAIIELVDQEQFDVSDGQASWKIQNTIALLIRK